MSDDTIMSRIRDIHADLTAIRRDIHAHPELGLEETRTAALVSDKLHEWGIEHVAGIGGTGIVATIRGKRPGQRAIGLRCDMDALSIPEQTGLGYASTEPGKMHACGHDGHTTMLLGAARTLAADADFSGTVHLIFQPAEEGRGGARAMLADGLFDRFPCDAIYGMHNWPGLAVGKFSIRKGPMMAGGCRWTVTFRGNGGHGGAAPHLASDLSVVQAHFVLALQTIVGRNVPPLDTAVISVGFIGGGSQLSTNVMPAEIVVGGTARCFTPEIQEIIERRMDALAQALATMHGATADVSIRWGVPPTLNHPEQTDVAAGAAAAIVGADAVDTDVTPTTGGEDFSEMLKLRPGAFIFIGNGEGGARGAHGLHTPLYDFNDAVIPTGVRYWVSLVEKELSLA